MGQKAKMEYNATKSRSPVLKQGGDRVTTKKQKTDLKVKSLLDRQDYLVVQANDLSKAFGRLTLNEHRLLDYATSFVTKDSTASDVYECDILDIIHHFGWNKSGAYYKRVADTFKSLHEKDSIYLYVNDKYGSGVAMVHLFDYINVHQSGKISFRFSLSVTPYLVALRKNYYSFKLSELARVRSKHTLIMLKLWEAHRIGNSTVTTIKGTLAEWQMWFLGQGRQMSAGDFRRDVLNVALKEIDQKLNVDVLVDKQTAGRRTAGFNITFKDHRGQQAWLE